MVNTALTPRSASSSARSKSIARMRKRWCAVERNVSSSFHDGITVTNVAGVARPAVLEPVVPGCLSRSEKRQNGLTTSRREDWSESSVPSDSEEEQHGSSGHC
jgi:hypothetical protein